MLKYVKYGFENIFQQTPEDKEQATQPIKILRNFYMEHDHLVEETLYDLTIPIIQYIYDYHSGYKFSEDLLKSGQRFFSEIFIEQRLVHVIRSLVIKIFNFSSI